jgi:hypothetical protein
MLKTTIAAERRSHLRLIGSSSRWNVNERS